MDKKFVVKVYIEGCLIQQWLAFGMAGWVSTESLLLANTFDTPAEAVEALSQWKGLQEPWCLGCEVIFKGLCHPNP